MPKITSMGEGLARLNRICPGISLSNKDILDIIDGETNAVIKRFNEKKNKPVTKKEKKIESEPKKSEDVYNPEVASNDEKAFDEYFND